MSKFYGLRVMTREESDRLFRKRARKQRRSDWLDSNDWMLWLAGAACTFIVWFVMSDYPEKLAVILFW